jgi:hypothetical protein
MPEEARRLGMAATIFHWALHPWAIYAIVALSLALFAYNKGLPLSVRSIFYPIFGERVWGWTGHVIDILAVFATCSAWRRRSASGRSRPMPGWSSCSASRSPIPPGGVDHLASPPSRWSPSLLASTAASSACRRST